MRRMMMIGEPFLPPLHLDLYFSGKRASIAKKRAHNRAIGAPESGRSSNEPFPVPGKPDLTEAALTLFGKREVREENGLEEGGRGWMHVYVCRSPGVSEVRRPNNTSTVMA